MPKYDLDDVFVRGNLNLVPDSFLTAKDSEVLARLSFLMRHWPDPHLYPSLLLSLLRFSPEFKKIRSVAHLSRLIAADYFYKRKTAKGTPQKRHMFVKLLRTRLEYPFGTKSVIGVVVTFNLLKQREAFEEPHIIESIRRIAPNVKVVEGSFIDYQDKQNQVHSAYLEIECEPEVPFTLEAIRHLQKQLPIELKGCIEQLVPMTFMRRNEEEVYRNILALRDQLKSVRDIPQATISFEEQTQFDLFFTVVLLRLIKGKEPSVKELFEKSNPDTVYIPDRVDIVGNLRKIYQKEATVFRLQLPKSQFYRKDRSVNLYVARRYVVAMLGQALGQIRDYNGGLMLKQNERLEDFLSIMPSHYDDFLLENFFYSITPIAMQSVLPASLVKEWFLALSELNERELSHKDPYLFASFQQEEALIVIVRADDISFKEKLLDLINQMEIPSLELAFSDVKVHGAYNFGFLYRPSQFGNEEAFCKKVRETMDQWSCKMGNEQTLSIALNGNEPVLDPRVTKEDQSYILIKMLFEGLTRIGSDGKPQLAAAESYETSDDYKKYTFYLRESKWSNGAAITAYDFEYSWKKALNPHYRMLFSDTLFLIKNARAAKEKKVGLDQVGIYATDERTLVVELEYSVPFFLEVVAHWTYSLINSLIDRINPGWAYQAGEKYVCNGPFKLADWKHNRTVTLVKNPHYWDADSVKLSQISVTMVDQGQNALRMLETGELDLIGYPMTPFPMNGHESSSEEVEQLSLPLCGVFSLAFNTQRFPFNHKKIRQAFLYAIDYEKIETLVNGECTGLASSILPAQLSLLESASLPKKDLKLARALFKEGLGEIGFVKSDFPRLLLSYTKGMRREVLFANLLKQWKEAFGISIHLESYNWRDHIEQMIDGRHQIGGVEVRALWHDPLHILEHHSITSHDFNVSHWEHSGYQALLNQAKEVIDLQERRQFLKKAEELIIEEVPLIPLYQMAGHSLKRRPLKNLFISDCFQVDFKSSFKET